MKLWWLSLFVNELFRLTPCMTRLSNRDSIYYTSCPLDWRVLHQTSCDVALSLLLLLQRRMAMPRCGSLATDINDRFVEVDKPYQHHQKIARSFCFSSFCRLCRVVVSYSKYRLQLSLVRWWMPVILINQSINQISNFVIDNLLVDSRWPSN